MKRCDLSITICYRGSNKGRVGLHEQISTGGLGFFHNAGGVGGDRINRGSCCYICHDQ